MNRVLKIIIYAVLLFLLYIWISSVAKSCNKEDKTNEMAAAETTDDFSADDEIYDEYFESEEGESTQQEDIFSDDYEYDEVPQEDQYVGEAETTGNEDDFSYESESIASPPTRSNASPNASSIAVRLAPVSERRNASTARSISPRTACS